MPASAARLSPTIKSWGLAEALQIRHHPGPAPIRRGRAHALHFSLVRTGLELKPEIAVVLTCSNVSRCLSERIITKA